MIPQSVTWLVALWLTVMGIPAGTREKADDESVRARIVGSWTLVSTEEAMADGSKRPYPGVGPKGLGYLMYSADGHMCAAGMNPDRPAWGRRQQAR